MVVDTEPTPGRNATKIGKDRYSSVEEAKADVKHLCKVKAMVVMRTSVKASAVGKISALGHKRIFIRERNISLLG